ncbi:MAG TPA: hypothetical protein VIG97_02295, partial [Luteimonas sp.]
MVPVTATYRNIDGTPARGSVTFTIPQAIVVDGVVAVPKIITATLDASGSIALELPATNDPDLSVTDWAYTVTERFPGGRKPFMIFVEHDAGAIDLAAVAPVVPASQLVSTRGPRGPMGDVTPAALAAKEAAESAAGAAVNASEAAAGA